MEISGDFGTNNYSRKLDIDQNRHIQNRGINLLLGNSYSFKNVDKTFNLKAHFSCGSSNLLYIIIYPTCGVEYTGETGIGKTKLRDHVRVYRKHIR